MTTDWKALCAELAENVRYLLDCVADGDSDPVAIAECVQHLGATRTLLSQPEPEEPTDEEMEEAPFLYAPEWYNNEMAAAWEAGRNSGWRDALARWGRPAIEPVPASERPWEREGWCPEGQCWMGDGGGNGFVPSWRLCKPSDCRLRWSLPYYALPVPETNGQT